MGHLYQPIKDVEYFAVAHLPHGVVGGADGGEGRALQVLRPDGVDPDASHHKPGDALGEETPQARVLRPCEAVPWPCDSLRQCHGLVTHPLRTRKIQRILSVT